MPARSVNTRVPAAAAAGACFARGRWSVLLAVLLGSVAGQQSVIRVRSGAELAAAILDFHVLDIVIDVSELTLLESDWPAAAPNPFVLERNLTLRGIDKSHPPVVRLLAKRKVQLGPNVDVRTSQLVFADARQDRDIIFTPGLDFIAPASSDPVLFRDAPPTWILNEAAVIVSACLPDSYYEEFLYSESLQTSPRYKSRQILIANVPQPGCATVVTNGSGKAHDFASARPLSAAASAVPEDVVESLSLGRCWPRVHFVVELGLKAFQPSDVTTSELGPRTDAHYYGYMTSSAFLCKQVVDAACIDRLGPVGCIAAALAMGAAPLPPLKSDSLLTSSDRGAAGASGPSSVPYSDGSTDGGGGGGGAPVGAIVGAAVGGVVGLALLGGLALMLMARRRRTGGGGKAGKLAAAEPACTSDPPSWEAHKPQDLDSSNGTEDRVVLDLETGQRYQKPSPGSDGRACGKACGSGGQSLFGSLLATTASQGDEPGGGLEDTAAAEGGSSAAPSGRGRGGSRCAPSRGVLSGLTPFRVDVHCSGDLQLDELTPVGSPEGPASSRSVAGSSPLMMSGAVDDNVVRLLPEVLGKGACGRVRKGLYRGQYVAVKQLLGEHDLAAATNAKALAATFNQELEVLARCEHPCIVRLLAACVKPFVVLEMLETSLDKLLYGSGAGLLPMPLVLHIGLEVARGLEYLHPTVTHRDLKPANVLINDPWGPKPVVKLTDFGLARLRETVMHTTNPEAGTPAYMAPECFDIGNDVITHKADMYALGVLLWEMLAGSLPWRGKGIVEVAYSVSMLSQRLPMPPAGLDSPPERWPRKIVRLIQQCWDSDPDRRPAAAEAVKWLALEQQREESCPASLGPGDGRVSQRNESAIDVSSAPPDSSISTTECIQAARQTHMASAGPRSFLAEDLQPATV
ncbi:hypothetical protein HYH03_015732 [Edaphochlamys debaryana]|uniref:Protein kinase domain-containing protein n=1 Tax=Edaphochlamys debaryana TaxID=47281 RepID=A0A835XK34_9CHLO|nr:hypothetical protein HYH03_015732 [Edaphochlamys debaryana]|eukprot:KAG2485568.1 hypothetical protein HYH03_015732 [Edaphochlamys debaryana]